MISYLPVELVGANVLSFLSLRDIIILERACNSEESHQLLLNSIPYCHPVELPNIKHDNISTLNWFSKRRFKLDLLVVLVTRNNPIHKVKNLHVRKLDLRFQTKDNLILYKTWLENDITYQIASIKVIGDHCNEVLEPPIFYPENFYISYSKNSRYNYWLNIIFITRLKLKELTLKGAVVKVSIITFLLQLCTKLTNIKLSNKSVDDAIVMAVAQHCHMLTKLEFSEQISITYNSLITLSERCLSLKDLFIHVIPNIPTADIARRCSHALSCIRHLDTDSIHYSKNNSMIIIPYMIGLTSIDITYYSDNSMPLLIQYCHNITKIEVSGKSCLKSDILSLCRANPLLQELHYYCHGEITDTTVIELVYACPQLHTLRLSNETAITDISILALSKHCTQLKFLVIQNCTQVTETAVLHLLQCCRKLTKLVLSSSSLSEET